jgi:hypothetical protein
VSSGSAAEKAGLHDGSLVVRARIPTEAEALGPARAQAELVLAGGKRIRFHPVGTRREKVWEAADCPAWKGRARARRD